MELDNAEALWKKFKASGSIKDYLEFCRKRRETDSNDN